VVVKPDDKPWLGDGEASRLLGSEIAAQIRAAGATSATVPLKGGRVEAQALAEGALLGDYRYLDCRSGKAKKRKPITLRLPGFAKEVAAAAVVAEAQNTARWFADSPGNLINPQTFLAQARKVLAKTGLKLKVVSGVRDLTKAGFPGLVQVGMAGSTAPALLE